MPKLKSKPEVQKREIPTKLKPYRFHGVYLDWQDSDKNAVGVCPFCDRDRKFQVNIKTGVSRCLVCNEGNDKGGMNAVSFANALLTVSGESPEVGELALDRNIDEKVLEQWLVCKSMTDGNWLVPGYNQDKKLSQVYSYRNVQGKKRLLPTPTLGHHMFGLHLWDSKKEYVWICEGPWDAMVLWDQLSKVKLEEDGLIPTSKLENSLLADSNVVGVPGVNTFPETWKPLFRNKVVNILFDNDHPKLNPKTERMGKPVGTQGMKRVAGIISSVAREVNYINWGEEGFNKTLKDGLDVKDLLTINAKGIQHRA